MHCCHAIAHSKAPCALSSYQARFGCCIRLRFHHVVVRKPYKQRASLTGGGGPAPSIHSSLAKIKNSDQLVGDLVPRTLVLLDL